VKALVSKVQLGEIDAGIVYITDTVAAGPAVTGVAIASEHNVVADYPIAVLTAGKHRPVAEAFVAFVLGDGQRILRSFGFDAP
jgi:molybdate transport system substrate-binding protein